MEGKENVDVVVKWSGVRPVGLGDDSLLWIDFQREHRLQYAD